MEDLEYAYFLTEKQFLFLLSLIDPHPVLGFSMEDALTVKAEDWKHVAVSLWKEKLLSFQENGIQIQSKLFHLLLGIKHAQRVIAIYSKNPAFPVRILYLENEIVAVEILPANEYRIHREEISAQWLVEQAGLSAQTAPSDLDFFAREDEEFQTCLLKWKECAVSFCESALRWGGIPEARTVIDSYFQKQLCKRWIWIEDTKLGGIVLCQDSHGTTVNMDVAEQREKLIEEFQTEGQACC